MFSDVFTNQNGSRALGAVFAAALTTCLAAGPAPAPPEMSAVFGVGNVSDEITCLTLNDDGTLNLIGNYTTGDGPMAVAVSPDGKYLAVTHGTGNSVETLSLAGYSLFGTLGYTEPLEWHVLEEDGTPSATTAADTDGDGRVQKLTLTASNLGSVKGLLAVAGDYIQVDGTGGRRIYEIKTIARDVPAGGQTEIVVTYDELPPSGTFTWKILKRRGLKMAWRRITVILKETPP